MPLSAGSNWQVLAGACQCWQDWQALTNVFISYGFLLFRIISYEPMLASAGKCGHMLVPIAVVSRKAMIQTYGRRTFGTGEFIVDMDVANQDFRHQFNRFAVVVALR